MCVCVCGEGGIGGGWYWHREGHLEVTVGLVASEEETVEGDVPRPQRRQPPVQTRHTCGVVKHTWYAMMKIALFLLLLLALSTAAGAAKGTFSLDDAANAVQGLMIGGGEDGILTT